MSTYTISLNGRDFTVSVKERRGGILTLTVNGKEYAVSVAQGALPTRSQPPRATPQLHSTPTGPLVPDIKAPLPGIISDIKVSAGETITAGTTLLIIEAMKMENPIKAPRDATVVEVHVTKGQEVAHAELLLSLKF